MEWKRFGTIIGQLLIVALVLFVLSAVVAGVMAAI